MVELINDAWYSCLLFISSQEAKRFTTIDKSWQKVMTHARENANIITCCTGDEMLRQLLPHLLAQLEQCQKSLAGYEENFVICSLYEIEYAIPRWSFGTVDSLHRVFLATLIYPSQHTHTETGARRLKVGIRE